MSTVREFRAGDGGQLVDTWRRSAPADPITPRRFRDLVLLDANFDPAGLRVAIDGDRLLGAAYAVRRRVAAFGDDLEPTTGWIPFFFVAPEARRRGVGTSLLRSALDWLARQGRTSVDFSSYTPNYILPGLDAEEYPCARRLLRRLGFRTVQEVVAMARTLVDHTVPAEVVDRVRALTAGGHLFATPADDDLVDLVQVAEREFAPDWARAIRACLTGGAPTDRILTARDPDGTLAGWAMHEAYEGMTERFGPFGVREHRRGAGLGRILLHLTLERMRAAGAQSAWFRWTSESSAAGQLYLRSGFRITRRFQVMRAELCTAR